MSERAQRLVELLRDVRLDAMLVTNLANVRYLTGFTGSNGIALVGPGSARAFVTDFRYVQQAAEQVDPAFERHRAPQDLLDAIAEVLPEGLDRLGFEDQHVSVRMHTRMRELLPEGVELVGAGGLVERLREVKSPEEVASIRAAAEIADSAFEQLVGEGLAGRTERELALALERHLRDLGATRPSFDAIVAGGPHGALPHAAPRDVRIQDGQMVVIDWGAEVAGYCSDCTRTVAVGSPSDEAKAAYELVLRAQLAGLDAVKAGAGGRDVDSVARAVIEQGGRGEQFGHGLGHGVGLEVHERPRLSQRSDDLLRAGNVVTVEPGVYEPGAFGIRIEDLVVVTDDRCEILTGISKELRIVE